MGIVRHPILVFGRLLTLVVLSCISAVSVCANPVSHDASASPTFTRFTSIVNPDVSIRFVSDSGICETTPGVHQMSGYIDVGTNMSMVRRYGWSLPNPYFRCSTFGLRLVVLVLWGSEESWHCTVYPLVCTVPSFRFRPSGSDLLISSLAKVEWRSWVFFNDWSLPRKWTLYSQCRWRHDDPEPFQVRTSLRLWTAKWNHFTCLQLE